MSDSPSIATTELSIGTMTGAVTPAPIRNAGGDPTNFSGTLFARDGALGANNSIFIDDTATPRAVFVAGSMGMRKLVVQGGV